MFATDEAHSYGETGFPSMSIRHGISMCRLGKEEIVED